MSDKCPKCGAEDIKADSISVTEFACKSYMYKGAVFESINCLRSQLTRLQAEKDEAEETFTAPDGEVWLRPTAEAYYQACQALKRRQEELTRLKAEKDEAERERDEAKETAEDYRLHLGMMINTSRRRKEKLTAATARADAAEKFCENIPNYRRWIKEVIVELSDQEASDVRPHTHVDFVDQIHGLARIDLALAALLTPAEEAPKPVKLPHPDLAYKALMARSEQLKAEEVRDGK